MRARRLYVGLTRIVVAFLGSRLGLLGYLSFCLLGDFYLACSLHPNSDSVQSYNEMLAIRAGNPLLHDWVLATDNFLLTDLPFFMLGALVLGPGPRLIYLVPFAVFALLLVACLLLVAAASTDRRQRLVGGYVILTVLGMPYGTYDLHYNFFLWSDFHVATLAACLYAILLVAPVLSDRRFHRGRLVPFTMLVFAVTFSDPMADGLLLGPLLLLVAARAWLGRRYRPDDWLLIGCTALGLAGGTLALHGLSRVGAFTTVSSITGDFVANLLELKGDAFALLVGVQILFTARASMVATLPLHELITASRFLVAIGVGGLSLLVIWRLPVASRDGVAHLLVLGGLCLAGLAAASATVRLSIAAGTDFPGAVIRYVVPTFVFLCVAAAIELGTRLAGCGPKTVRLAVAVGLGLGIPYMIGGVATVARMAGQHPAIRTMPQRVLADWLRQHGLTHGVGDYWDTQLVTALSGGRVIAEPVGQLNGRLLPFPWLTDTGQFKSRHPQFVIITPGGKFGITQASAVTTYGPPSGITKVAGQYLVAVFKD